MQNARPFDILPAIDLRGGRVVRLAQGDFDRETAYDGGSGRDRARVRDGGRGVAARRRSRRRPDGRPGASRDRRDHRRGSRGACSGRGRGRPARCPEPWPTVIEEGQRGPSSGRRPWPPRRSPASWSTVHGAARIAVAIDVRDGRAVGHGWSETDRGVDAVDAIGRLADQGVQTFEVTAIDRDGLLGGPDLALYERLVALDSRRDHRLGRHQRAWPTSWPFGTQAVAARSSVEPSTKAACRSVTRSGWPDDDRRHPARVKHPAADTSQRVASRPIGGIGRAGSAEVPQWPPLWPPAASSSRWCASMTFSAMWPGTSS